MKQSITHIKVPQLKRFWLLVTCLLLGTLGVQAYDIDYFENSDLQLEFKKDVNNPANNQLVIKFLAHHGKNDDGWRKDEKGANFYLKDVQTNQEYHLGRFFHDDDYDTKYSFEDSKNEKGGFQRLTGKLYEVNACRTHGSALKPSDHSCKSDHYSYTTITYNIPVSALNHEIKVQIKGRYWRWKFVQRPACRRNKEHKA